jgi:predicted alpha/beta-hydrolase family hydrolase
MNLRYLILSGDSAPKDDYVLQNLEQQLGVDLARMAHTSGHYIERVRNLEAVLDADPSARFVLLGRSSGARVVTIVAANPAYASRVAAVIVMGYPFRNPESADEPERYAHLPDVAPPCLIMQGTIDKYGGATTAGDYLLSSTTRLRFFPMDHAMKADAAVWNDMGSCAREFLAEVIGGVRLHRAVEGEVGISHHPSL